MNDINRSTRLRQKFVTAVISLPVLLLSACESGQLSVGMTLTLNPSSQHYTITEEQNEHGVCIYYEQYTTDLPVQVDVQASDGSYVGGAEVRVYADYASNLYTGRNVMEIYVDKNNNGVVDPEDEIISAEGDGSYRVETGEYTGSTLFFVRLNLSCSWRGSVRAYAGDGYASMEISVSGGEIE